MSSSSSTISATTVNGTTRYTGLSSGIDVDTIVTELVTAEKAKKLNKLEQKEQKTEWTQDAYRTIISDIQAFSSKYFNATSSSSLLSAANFNQYTVTSSSVAVTASTTSSTSAGTHIVTVSQLATAATLKSGSSIFSEITGNAKPDYSSLSGKSIAITLDGTSYTVSLSSVTDLSSLQTAINAAVGSGKLTVGTDSSGYLTIAAATTTNTDGTTSSSGINAISISAPDSGTSGLSSLGFGSGSTTSNRPDISTATLADISGLTFDSTDDNITLTINGKSISFDKSTTIQEMIDDISDADCGATLEYDETTGKLVLSADKTGAGNTLTVSESDSGNFLATCLSVSTAGTDAKVTVDGTAYTRSTNSLTVDGVSYTFNATTDSSAAVTLTQDTDAIYELIDNFVTDYNSLLATINDELEADYDSDYPPLTDDEKADMSEAQITNYEEKAKTGLLHHDSTLESFLNNLRSTMIDSISGVSTTIFDIGIDTTDSYDDKGKLTIDEAALKAAIKENPAKVVSLFTQQATSVSGSTGIVRTLDSQALSTRYEEEGIAYRFYDVLAKYTSTIKDSSGNKGLLLEKAGITGDSSASDNALSDRISKYQDEIDDEKDRISSYEDRVYKEYSSLETYINKMNSQLSSLQSYFSSSS